MPSSLYHPAVNGPWRRPRQLPTDRLLSVGRGLQRLSLACCSPAAMAKAACLLLTLLSARLGGAWGDNRTLQACINSFEIHADKIIRTDDSRRMGAKYISESDVQTREECVRLCCATDVCDVFVFEDKRPGSCYLFNCGSSDDFKCKFTKHHNYTSGIMSENHQDRDLSSKHEQELNLLRASAAGVVPSPGNRSSSRGSGAPAGGPLPASLVPPNRTADPAPSDGNACSRFQFQCRVSGECIAIYNVCDGIPQCADATDEDPELNCPVAVPSPSLPAAAAPPTRNMTEPAAPRPTKEGPAADDAPPPPHTPADNEAPPPYAGFRPYMNVRRDPDAEAAEEERSYLAAKALNERTEHNYRSQFPNAKLQAFLQEQNGLNKAPAADDSYAHAQRLQQLRPVHELQAKPEESALRQLADARFAQMRAHDFRGPGTQIHPSPYDPSPYNPSPYNPSLYSHTHLGGREGSLKSKSDKDLALDVEYNNPVARNDLKVATQVQAAYAEPALHEIPARLYKYEDENRHIFTHKGYGLVADGDSSERAHKLVAPGVHFKADDDDSGRHLGPSHDALAAERTPTPDKLFKMLKNTPQPVEARSGFLAPPDYVYDELPPRPALTPDAPRQAPRPGVRSHDAPANASAQRSSPPHRQQPPPPPPPPPRAQQAPSEAPEKPDAAPRGVEGQRADVLQLAEDPQRDRPSGALLSMSFGLCITLIMAVLVACRLKVVKRRFRRNGKSMYAHDADYLVNGMYL